MNYKVYWVTWLALLALTLMMIFVGGASMPRTIMVSLLLLAMLVKATLICAYFMHLRSERLALVLTVVVGIAFTSAALFLLLVPDGVRIFEMNGQ
jgi:cytochrome c oxidase subunit IV